MARVLPGKRSSPLQIFASQSPPGFPEHFCVAHRALEEAPLWYVRRSSSRKEYLCVAGHRQLPAFEEASWSLYDEGD